MRGQFQARQWGSGAVDTALFLQDNVLSWFARFTDDDNVEQHPLFFSVCSASTGEELAKFLLDRLSSIDAPSTNCALSQQTAEPICWTERWDGCVFAHIASFATGL